MRKTLLATLATLGMVLAPAHLAAQAKDPDTITIGAIFAMTGKADWYGKVMSQGAQLAIDEINAAGGVNGAKLALAVEDHKGGVAKDAVAGMNRLINLHDVQAVLTSFTPSTLAVAPIADEKGIMMINGGGVSQSMVGASKYLFHNRSLSTDLGRAAAMRANELGLKRMAQLAWKTEAGENVAKVVEPYWKQLGGKIVATEFMETGASNIDTQIAKIRASNPDVVALWMFSPDPGTAMKRIREFGMKVPVIGIEYTPDVQKVGGKALEGYEYTTDYFEPTSDNQWGQRFSKAYRDRYGEEPEFYAANYYEGVYVIAEALKRARAQGGDYYDGAKLAVALRANPTVPSVYGGEMTFADNGVASKPVALFKVQDGKGAFQKYIKAK
jgi:branched-chain amino acid transport system substrate-binding protein